MKSFRLKYYLSRHGLLPAIDLIRRTPECIRWLQSGASGFAPAPIKRWVIATYLRRYGFRQFVETGTHLGDTLAQVARDRQIQCTSIELADSYYLEAVRRFSTYPNVRLLHGDSGILLPQLVAELKQPALFWLDGHYSGGTTAKGQLETPISVELRAILNAPISGHIILIDDVRCFDGTHDYPYLDQLLRDVRQDGHYTIEVSADIARLTPSI